MNTLEIRKNMKKIHDSLVSNVFAANRLPVRVYTPISLISNLDTDEKPGSHWVAIRVNPDGVGEYFDSFGRKPQGFHKRFLDRNTKRWFYSNTKLQSYFTSVCGEYCLVYLYFRHKGITMLDFLKLFSDDSLYNDIVVDKIYKCIFLQT